MKKLIIALLIVGCVFAQNSNVDTTVYFHNEFDNNNTDTTLLNVNEFVTIYYEDGSFSTHDSTQSACNISFGVGVKREKSYSLVDCYMFADGDSNNIINVEHIDRMVKRDGEIITGKKIRKTFNMIRIIGTSTIYILAGGIIISLVLLV